jgi:peroxiredoxin
VLNIAAFAALAVRLLLAAVFLLAGATKLVDPVGLRKALRDFGAPPALARPMVMLLPVLELAVAALLIPTSLAWYGAWGALALLTLFLIAVGVAMIRGRKPDCHCFGQLHSAPVGWPTLLRNAVLAASAGWLASRGRSHSGTDLWAWVASLGATEFKVVLVALCAAGFAFLHAVNSARPKTQPVEVDVVPEPVDEEEVEEVAKERAPSSARTRQPRPAPPPEPSEPARPGPMGIGLPVGSPAPEFKLPALTGEIRSLQSFRERGDVLLVFSSPFCEPCTVLASNLVRWRGEINGLPRVVLVSRGTPRDNIAKLKGFETSMVLLQRESEVSESYDCLATPSAVLVGADGRIQSDLVTGGVEIKKLLLSAAKPGKPSEPQRQTQHKLL